MSKKQWMVLLMLFLTYLLLGASIFYHIESKLEIETVELARKERIEINELLQKHYFSQTERDQNEILKKLTRYCGKSVYSYGENETDPMKWDFYNSFYFAYTVVSTIGYGNLAPTNMLSRILMIFYAVVGIPMNGILLAQLGDFFSIVFIRAHEKYKSYKKNHNNNNNECKKKLSNLETRKAGLAVQILMYLIPGFAMFIFFPAFVFSHYEGWSYEEAVYYAFVTLTTIGFGDYVAGQDNAKGSGILFIIYKSFLIAWISFGLGYIVMIMTFITRGMRSKKIVRLEHKLALNLKQTQSKIWSEFNKEVNYLRRVFNELQLSKVKRVWVDEYDDETPRAKLMRSNSFPDLRKLVYGGLPSSAPTHPRRRANSEVVPMERTVIRVVSETDLQRIDKTATFATHAIVQPAELLARLVNVLGYIPPPIDDDDIPEVDNGIQGFSDKEILSNERSSNWKLGGDKIPFQIGKPRSRASSEIQLDPSFEPNPQRNQEWTWSGPAASRKIQELIKARRNANVNKESKSKFGALNLPKSVPLPRWIKQLSTKKDSQQTRNSLSAGDLDSTDDSYLSNMTGQTYFTHTGAANLSSTLEGSNLLEETSLADFLRALTALHARVGAVPDEFVKKPQRKMGTACLTPPSLFTLFSPPEVPQSTQSTVTSTGRRFSLRTAENSSCSTPTYDRRSSAIVNKPKGRRFSLRPVTTPIGSTPTASPFLPGTSRKESPPYNSNSFAFECPKEPLVSMEGAPGVSSPVITAESRRLSLRPMPGPTKGIPKWKAGMLQRQINQLSLQRRVRAFSLGDVNADDTRIGDKNIQISPLALNTRLNVASKDVKNSNQKTVTIVSPSLEQKKNYQRNNPFVDSKGVKNPFIANLEKQGEDRTMFQVLREVKNIKTVPTTTVQESETIDKNNSDGDRNENLSGSLSDVRIIDNKSMPGISVNTDRSKRSSVVSITHWNDVKRNDNFSRKISTVSEHSTSTDSSRKNSSIKNPNDKSRQSIDSDDSLLEIKVDKNNQLEHSNKDLLDSKNVSLDKDLQITISTGLEDPRESST